MKKTATTFFALLLFVFVNLGAQNKKPVQLGWVVKTEPLGLLYNKGVLAVERKITNGLSVELKGGMFHHTDKGIHPVDLKGYYFKAGAKIYTHRKAGAPASEALHGFYIKPEIGYTNFNGYGRKTQFTFPYYSYTYRLDYKVSNWQVLMSFGTQNFLLKRFAVDTFFGWGVRMAEPSYRMEGERTITNLKGGNNYSSYAFWQGRFVISGGVCIGLGI